MTFIDIAVHLQEAGLGTWAFLAVLKVTVVLAIACLLTAAIPRTSAAARHLLLTSALCGSLLLPLLTLATPSWRLPLLSPAPPAPVHTVGATGEEDVTAPPTAIRTAVTVAEATGLIRREKVTAAAEAIALIRQSWQIGVILLLLAGVAVFLFRMAVGIAGVGFVARTGMPVSEEWALRELQAAREHLQLRREVQLLWSNRVNMPVVWGFARPILLLPESARSWPAERLRVVLLHELAHVRRGDGATLILTRTAVALFWFNPLAWIAERQARAACERACDDLVLSSGARPSDYAEHLLSIAKALPQVDPFRAVTLAMTRQSQLEGRLLSILHSTGRRAATTFSSRTVLTMSVLALLLLVPLASIHLVAAPGARKAAASVDVWASRNTPQDEEADTPPQSGKEWYSRGYDMLRKDRYAEAVVAFRESCSKNHRCAESLYNMACAYAQLDDPANAVGALRKAWSAGFDNAEHFADDPDLDPIRESAEYRAFLASIAHGEEGGSRLDAALQQYAALRNSASRDGQAWFAAGLDLLRLRRLDESAEAFRQARAAGFKVPTSEYNLACVYARKGELQAALDTLQKSIEEGGDAANMDGDADLAALRGSPRFAELRRMATDLSLSTWNWTDLLTGGEERWRGQLEHFREMTSRYPSSGRPWFNLGYAALQVDRPAEAVQAFQRALQMGYRPPVSMYNTACAYARAGNTDAAIQALLKARAAGFDLGSYIDKDEDLENLRDDPRFERLADEVRASRKEHSLVN